MIPTSADGEIGAHDRQEVLEAGEARATPAIPADDGDEEITIDFSKKRKKKKAVNHINQSGITVAGLDIEQVLDGEEDRSRRDAEQRTCCTNTDGRSGSDIGVTHLQSDPYSYGSLLSRLFDKLQQEHPNHPTLLSTETGRARKSNVPPPALARVGGRRVAVCNFGIICSALRRPPAHVQSFFETELATTTSLDGQNDVLTMLGRFTDKQVEQLLRKYIHEYVVCAQCKALETHLHKTCGRELLIRCACCNAEESRAAIKSGFRAVSKGERRVARALGA